MAGPFVQGTEAVFTLTNSGSFTFAWPANFLNTPILGVGAGVTTAATFQYCGAVGSGAACPAGDWQNTDVGPSGSGFGSQQIAAVRLSTSCPVPTDANCFQVNQDGQVSLSSTWTANTSNGTAATLLTIGDAQSGAQYLHTATPQTNVGGIFTQSTGGPNASILAAFKISGSLGVPASCPGISNQSASSTTVSQAITPANSGAGSVLIAFATEGASAAPDEASITFTDNNGNTWNNVISRPLVYGGNESVQMAYVQNNNSGATTVTATFATAATFRTLTVCNFSGMASSGVLDAAAWGVSPSNTIYAGTVTTTGNDLLIQFARTQTAFPTYTVGTLAISGNTVTNGSSDPIWTAASVGQKLVGGSQCQAGNGFINCTSPFINPSVTIIAVNSPHNITVSSLLSTSNTAPDAHGFTGFMITAHDDGAQYAAATAKAITIPNSTVFLPCGTTIIGQQPFNFPGHYVWNPNIVGCAGETGTVLVPSSDYNFAGAVGGFLINIPFNNNLYAGAPGTSNQSIYGRVEKFAVWGITNVAGSGQAIPIININNTELNSVDITSFTPSQGAGSGGAAALFGTSVRVNNFHCWICGPIGFIYNGNDAESAEPGDIKNSYFQGTGISIVVNGGELQSSNNSEYGSNGNCSFATSAGVQVNGGLFTSRQDYMAGISVTGGIANIEDNFNTASGCAGDVFISGGTLTAHRARIDSLTMSSGAFNDLGANYHTAAGTPWTTGTLAITGGSVIGTASITGVAITAAKLVLSAGWGASAAWTSLSGNTRLIQGTITNTGAGQAASPTITYTFPTPFAQAANIVCEGHQVGGNQPILSTTEFLTPSALSNTGVTLTYNGTPTVNDTEIIQISCDSK